MIFYKKYCFVFILFLVAGLSNSYGQADCSTAVAACTEADSGGVVFGFGKDDFNGLTQSGCLKTSLNGVTIEANSYWIRVTLAQSGEFGFDITPEDMSEDWDFAVYGPNPTCGALGNPVRCDFVAGVGGSTGVGDPTTDPDGPNNPYDSWMDVNAGEEYLILVNQYDGNKQGFTISWKGAVMELPDPLDCSNLVDLGPDRKFCSDAPPTTLNATIFGAISYEWSKKNSSGNYEPFTPAETESTLVVSTSGDYQVEVIDNLGIPHDSEINVQFDTVPIANPVEDLSECDLDADGFADFDLESRTAEILNLQTGMSVTYYRFKEDAIKEESSLTSPYSSDGETVWARIQNDSNSNCYDLTSFDLVITNPLIANQPDDLWLCDDNNDGFAFFDLEQLTPIILGTQIGVVHYFIDPDDAKEPKGWIPDPSLHKSGSGTIWARVETFLRSGCETIISFEINVYDSAVANKPENIKQCDIINDGLYEFDLKALKDLEILGIQLPANFEVLYFATQANADTNVNALPNPYENVTAYATEIIYARVQNRNQPMCFETTSFTLQVFDSAYPAPPENIPDLAYCDDLSDGNDTNGFFEFDLTERAGDILFGQSAFLFDITYFDDPGYSSPIPNPTAFTNSMVNEQTIYVMVSNNKPNNISCNAKTAFLIKVNPLPVALLSPFDFVQCDEDGVPDGIVDFVLLDADTYVSLGSITSNVSYHISIPDAESGINDLNKNAFSNNISPIVYARVESTLGCFRIVEVNLGVSVNSFPSGYMHEFIQCDTDGLNDGFHEFNLALVTSEIISLFTGTNLRVAYYRNQADALYRTNNINTANAYLNETAFSQLIWVRVESSINGGCFAIAPVLQLTVNPIPEFELEETAVVCLNNTPKTVFVEEVTNETGTFKYEWTDEFGNVISNQAWADFYQAGVYTVIASNLNCDSFPKQIVVSESIIADFSVEDIQVVENAENNTLTVITGNQNLGIGEYEFSLDDRNGPYQDDPVFTQVTPGQHTIFVREKNGCGVEQATVFVFGFPNFFTPNNDGVNDFWNIRGVDPAIFTDSKIVIFDRYGKMLTSFRVTEPGWDGMYNNNLANSSDYWYVAELVDISGRVSVHKGHFSLVR